jgi:hypothetical protein
VTSIGQKWASPVELGVNNHESRVNFVHHEEETLEHVTDCFDCLVIVQWCCSFIDRWGSSLPSTLGPNPFREIEN